MKNKIDRFKIKTSRFSIRSIAVVLCFVMLLTAIGSGSVLSAIAAGVNQPTVSSAIKTVIDCADQDVSNDEVALQKKGDSDLAGTGYTNAYIKKVSGGSTSNLATISLTSDAGAISVDTGMSAGETLNFYIAYSDNGDTRASWTNNGYSLSAGEIYDCNGKTYNSSDKNYFSYTILNSGVLSFNVFESAESICVTEGYELRYGTTSGAWAFGHGQGGSVTTLAPSGTSNEYTAEITFDSATTNYFFVSDLFDDDQNSNVQNKGYYYKPSSDQTASLGTSYSLDTEYGNNYGNSGNKIAFTPTKDKAYKFTFNNSSKTLTITNASYDVSISAGSNGSISTSPATLTGLTGSQTITVTATPDTGYHPVWPAGFTSTGTNTATVTVTGAATYSVTFAKDKYNVTANAASNGSYTLSKSGSQEWGTTINVQNITPNAGYELDKITYTAGTSDPVDITTAKSFTLGKADTSVTVTFKKSTYDITKGTVTGDGCDITIDKSTAQIGDTITVTCTPATGYKISTVQFGGANATQDGSNENKWTYTLNASNVGDKTVTATFVKEDYAITKTVSPAGSGTISVTKDGSEASQYNIGDTLTLTATPATHYTFTGFTSTMGTIASASSASTTLDMTNQTGPVTITASFAKTNYTGLTAQGAYSTTGEDGSYNALLLDSTTISSSSGTNQDGVTVTATSPAATPTGYTFVRWVSANGTFDNATSATTTFHPTSSNAAAVAQYKKNYTVTASVNNSVYGSITGTTPQTVAAGDTVTYTFTPASGYGLSSLLVNDVEKLSAATTDPYSFTSDPIKANTKIVATFSSMITATASVSNTNKAGSEAATPRDRFHPGEGTVSINGGTASSTTATAPVATGSMVTFTATPNEGYGFGGWYSDATCETLVSATPTMTVPYLSATTYYAAFVEDNYYLIKQFYLADYALHKDLDINNTDFAFTQSASNPGIFTYENDFMFKTYTENSSNQYHNQYVSIGWGSDQMYTVSTSTAGNNTAASGITKTKTDWSWIIDQDTLSDANYYKHVVITWDAINEKMSWTMTDIDWSQYTVLKVKADTTWTWDHIWCSKADTYIKLIGTPSEEIGDDVYNVVIIKNSTLGSDELKCKLHKQASGGAATGDGNETAEYNGMYAGGVYSIDTPSSAGGTVTSSDTVRLAGQYSDGSAGFFTNAMTTTFSEMKEMTTSDNLTYIWEVTKDSAGADSNSDGLIDTGTIQYKVNINADIASNAADAYRKHSYAGSYKIKNNIVKLTFTYNVKTHAITVTPTFKEADWMYSKNNTVIDPTNGMSNFNSSDTTGESGHYGQFRFMYGTSDTGLSTAATPQKIKTYNDSVAYWVDLTSAINGSNNNFFFGLCSYGNKGNLVGNKSEEINDDTENKAIENSDGQTIFQFELKQNDNVSSSAKYVLIRSIDWSKVSAIGVLAYDKSGSYNSQTKHNGKVDYQIYYKPKITEEPDDPDDTTVKTVDIYAKDGSLRDDTFNRFARMADTSFDQTYFSYTEVGESSVNTYNSITDYNNDHADKQITVTTTGSYGTGATYEVMTNVPVGAKIKLKTQMNTTVNEGLSFGSSAFADSHYMKAYSFNGMTYQLHTANENATKGLYEEVWTVRDVNTAKMKDKKTIEVTPIYYMQDNSNCKPFYIDGYDGTVQSAWGNMLNVYPYYEGKSNSANAFGGYPGQPMLFWGGKYQMEIPLTVDGTSTGASVKGLTLHNAYWDLLHRSLDTQCSTKNHAQTYDYDDFYKLYKEKNPDTIIFDFKYTTDKDNYSDGYQYTNYTFANNSTFTASDYNSLEVLTDYFGRQVDVFGNLLTDANQTHYDPTAATPTEDGDELRIVSTGYKDTYVGEYATIWAVYAPSSTVPSGSGDTANTFIGYISSSMLYLNSLDRTKQYTDGTNTAAGRMSWQSFTDTYTKLKDYYTGVPALISYDEEIWNGSKDQANRSDGKWYYSNNSDKVSANIKIQYAPASVLKSDDVLNSALWSDDAFSSSVTGVGGYNNIGSVTGCSAYFTNTTPNLKGKVSSGEVFSDNDKFFTFNASSAGSYLFVDWVRYSNGKYYEITDNEEGQSNMSSNDTYIARFIESETGNLSISHVVEQTSTYTGTGTPSLRVQVNNGTSDVVDKTVTDGSKIDISDYINTKFKTYTISISLTTTPDSGSESYMKEIVYNNSNTTFAPSPATFSGTTSEAKTATVTTFTVQNVLDANISDLRYVSHLMKPTYTYKYEITYTYTSRFWGEQSYKVDGTFGSGEDIDNTLENSATGTKTSAVLNAEFIENKTPFEKNFRQKINWNYTDSDVGEAHAMVNNAATLVAANTYKMTAHVYSSNTVNDKVKAEIILPYDYEFNAETGYSAKPQSLYDASGNILADQTEVVYDDSIEGPSIETQMYKLFTYDNLGATGGGSGNYKLVEAAPFVWKDATKVYNNNKVKTRYMTGHSEVVDDTTYYYFNKDDDNTKYYFDEKPEGATGTVLTSTSGNSIALGEKAAGAYSYAVSGTYTDKGVTRNAVYYFNADTVEKGEYRIDHIDPDVIGVQQDTGTKKYFTRWDIYNTSGKLVASSYSRKFNYSGYENYVVRAIYNSDTENAAPAYDSTATANINYLGDSRNQWNNNGGGNYNRVTGKSDPGYGDKLFTDFAIAYTYGSDNKEIQRVESSEAVIKLGMVIEAAGTLDTSNSNYIYDPAYYTDKLKGDITSAHIEKIATALQNGGSSAQLKAALGHSAINSKIGANVAGWGTQFDPDNTDENPMGFTTVVDNFNRLQWSYMFTNNKTNETLGNAGLVYRAWSYIIVGGTAYVSSTPAYFTLYYSATR